MFELIEIKNRLYKADVLFEDFSNSDMIKFIMDIVEVYKDILAEQSTIESFASVPSFRDIMDTVTYLYCRKLYNICATADAKEKCDALANIHYLDLMEFVHSILKSYNLTYCYNDNGKIKVVNDAQLNIFDL